MDAFCSTHRCELTGFGTLVFCPQCEVPEVPASEASSQLEFDWGMGVGPPLKKESVTHLLYTDSPNYVEPTSGLVFATNRCRVSDHPAAFNTKPAVFYSLDPFTRPVLVDWFISYAIKGGATYRLGYLDTTVKYGVVKV